MKWKKVEEAGSSQGQNIKTIATFLRVLFIGEAVAGAYIWSTGYELEAVLGIVILATGIISAIMTGCLDGFARLVDDVHGIRRHLAAHPAGGAAAATEADAAPDAAETVQPQAQAAGEG